MSEQGTKTDERCLRACGAIGALKEQDEQISEIVEQIKPRLEEKLGEKLDSVEAINYKTQTVAGCNYFVKVKTISGQKESFMHLRIYRNLEGQLELSNYQADKSCDEEIAYF